MYILGRMLTEIMFTGLLPFLFVLIFPFIGSAAYPYLSTRSVKGTPFWMGRIFFVAFTIDRFYVYPHATNRDLIDFSPTREFCHSQDSLIFYIE